MPRSIILEASFSSLALLKTVFSCFGTISLTNSENYRHRCYYSLTMKTTAVFIRFFYIFVYDTFKIRVAESAACLTVLKMIEAILQQFSEFVLNRGEQLFWTLFTVIVIVISKLVLNRLWSRGVNKLTVPKHIANILRAISNVAAIVVFFVISTTIWSVEGSWLVGGLGISAGTIIGFASSDTIGNTIAGFIILFSRPFTVGHRIRIGDHLGDVQKISLVYTTLMTPNLEEINIPNRRLLDAEIVNFGRLRSIRIALTCTVDYSVDIDSFKIVLVEAASSINGVASIPAPYVWVSNLGNYAAQLTLYVHTYSSAQIPQVKADLREAIWRAYKLEGVTLTTPTLIQSLPITDSDLHPSDEDDWKQRLNEKTIMI
ncbi:MAG: mechanosensitive ion channel [Candidatus Bathyarchaeota archaeon]|nr:MAG: mechanosensitive ion channel [Candidatus Bathyarchaeota archaeon]